MIKSNNILYSKGKNDEFYTPLYAVKPIVDYILKLKGTQLTVWCPFDKDDSNFVKYLKEKGFNVLNSHIDNGQDFYSYEPEKYDIILSNPPFTGKRKIFERAISLNKPFGLLMSNTWLNDSAPKQLFKDIDLQLFMFEKRIHFIQPNGEINKKTTFSSSYYCYNLLDKQIVMSDFKYEK